MGEAARILGRPWLPLPGPQTDAFFSDADITGYGGAAGGGKTDLEIGLALTEHRRSIIYRREGTQLLSIRERMNEVLGTSDHWNGQDQLYRLPDGRTVELGGCKDIGSEKKYQGRPHDLKCFDEATEFAESQVRFLMGWLRSERKGRKRVLMTFNPPTTVEGRWVIRFFAPWLEKGHPNPARPGELRWFTTDPETGKDIEVDGPGPHVIGGEPVRALSRTFVPASVEDNPYYMESGYKAVLQALPEPLRSQMLKGDFSAGVKDDPWQVIPTEWVRQAQARWRPDGKSGPMDALGCDPARGGDDRTAICSRYGDWFSEVQTYPGGETPDGPAVAALCVANVRDEAPIHVDVIGIGSSVVDHLSKLHVVAVNGSEKAKGTDETGNLRFVNRRAELWWKMREALDPRTSQVALPPGDDLLAELTAPKFSVQGRGIQVEPKDKIKERLSRSPDKAEAVVYANIATAKDAAIAYELPPVASSWMA